MIGVSQARMSHVMALALLSPGIQEAILLERIELGDKHLRGLARVAEWGEQVVATDPAVAR